MHVRLAISVRGHTIRKIPKNEIILAAGPATHTKTSSLSLFLSFSFIVVDTYVFSAQRLTVAYFCSVDLGGIFLSILYGSVQYLRLDVEQMNRCLLIERGRFFEPAGGGCHCVLCIVYGVLCIVYYKSTINWHLFPRKNFNWSGGKITSWITFHIFIRHFHA